MSYGGFFEDYGDDYYEPTLAEEIFEEAKTKLEEAVKAEIKNKIQAVEELLAEQDKKEAELRTKENKLNWREKELESKFRDIENEFKKEKFDKFIKDLQKYLGQKYYRVDNKYEKKLKCKACDDERRIEIKMPDGSVKKINCSCNTGFHVNFVKEVPILSVSAYKDKENISVYLQYCSWDERLEKISPKSIYAKFDDVENKDDMYNKFYTNKEEAQKHADYLNNLNKLKDSKNGN